MSMATKLFIASAVVVGVVGCGGEVPGAEDSQLGQTEAGLTYYPDTQPDPLPTTYDVVQPNAYVTIPPGYRACYPALSANNSAGIGGYIAYQGLTKAPRVVVFWGRTFSDVPSKIYAATVSPGAYGDFENVLNRSNGYSAYFPGVFQFCVKNPSVNTQPVYLNASVVTY